MAKIKVSQKTIDDIKKMGMTKALKLAGMNASATQAGAVAEYQEAAKRMYGAKRVAAADKAYRAANAPKKPTDSRFSSGTAKKATSGTYTTGSGVSKAKTSGTYTTGSGVSTKKAATPAKKAVAGPTTQGGRAKYFKPAEPKKVEKKKTTTTGPRTQGGRAKYYKP